MRLVCGWYAVGMRLEPAVGTSGWAEAPGCVSHRRCARWRGRWWDVGRTVCPQAAAMRPPCGWYAAGMRLVCGRHAVGKVKRSEHAQIGRFQFRLPVEPPRLDRVTKTQRLVTLDLIQRTKERTLRVRKLTGGRVQRAFAGAAEIRPPLSFCPVPKVSDSPPDAMPTGQRQNFRPWTSCCADLSH